MVDEVLEESEENDVDADSGDDSGDDSGPDSGSGEGAVQSSPSSLRSVRPGKSRGRVLPQKPGPKSDSASAEASNDKAPEKKKRKDDLKFDRNGDLKEQWRALFEKSKSLKAPAYKMSDSFEARTPIVHKVLGWGFILTSQNNRLEVLFEEGLKVLISNYKA